MEIRKPIFSWLYVVFMTCCLCLAQKYYFHVTIVNHYGKDVTIITTHPNSKYHRIILRNSEDYRITSTHSSIVTVYITAYNDIHLIQIDGKNYVRVSTTHTPNNRTYFVTSESTSTVSKFTTSRASTDVTSTVQTAVKTTTGVRGMYYFHVTIVNNYGKDITITTTHPNPKYRRFMICNGENYQISSAHSITKTMYITAYHGLFPIKIDGKTYVQISTSHIQDSHQYYVPSKSSSSVRFFTLTPSHTDFTSTVPSTVLASPTTAHTTALYYFDVTIVNRHGKDLTIVTTHPNAKYRRFMIRNGQIYKIKSVHSTSKTMYITAYEGIFPIQIDGENYVQVTTSLTQNSFVYNVNSETTSGKKSEVIIPRGAGLGEYYIHATVMNHYGKDVTIMTTHPDSRYRRFKIRSGKTHQIKPAHSTRLTIYIIAYDGLIPIQIDGKSSVRLTASPARENRVYYVSSEPTSSGSLFTSTLASTDPTSTKPLSVKTTAPLSDHTSSRFAIKDLKISSDVGILPIAISDRNSRIASIVTQDSHVHLVPASSELHYGRRLNTFFDDLLKKYCFNKIKLRVWEGCRVYVKDASRSLSQT